MSYKPGLPPLTDLSLPPVENVFLGGAIRARAMSLGGGMDVFGRGALVVLAAIAVVMFLYWGAPFFIPLFVALLIAYALAPVTDVVTRFVKWRAVAATLVVSAVVGLLGAGVWTWA